MREILFRGKRRDTEEWLYWDIFGRIICDDGKTFNFVEYEGNRYWNIVDLIPLLMPGTVGECAGLTDKNRKKIFEGDILSFEDVGEEGFEYKEAYDLINKASVCFINGRWELTDFLDKNSGVLDDMNYNHYDFILIFKSSEVIGNIYDNPELLEEGAE